MALLSVGAAATVQAAFGDDALCSNYPISPAVHYGCKVNPLSGPSESSVSLDRNSGRVVVKAADNSNQNKPTLHDPMAWATSPGETYAPHIAILEFGIPYCDKCKVMHQVLDLIQQACASPDGNVKSIEAVDGAFMVGAKTPQQLRSTDPDVSGCGPDCTEAEPNTRYWTLPSAGVAHGLVKAANAHSLMIYPPDPPNSQPTLESQQLKALGIDGDSMPAMVVLVNGHVAYLELGRAVGPPATAMSLDNLRAVAKRVIGDMVQRVNAHLPAGVKQGLDCSHPLADGSSL